MTDLWHEASADHDLEAREASLAVADAEMMPVYSFLFQSRTPRELEHRLAFAATRLVRVSDATGIPVSELEETARRRYALLKEALPEGVDPLTTTLQSGQSFGTGPAQGYEHDEGPDFSHGYSEIPAGPPGGPSPAVTQVAEPSAGPVTEATASLCRCGSRLTKRGKCRTCRSRTANCLCRTADVTSGSPPSGQPLSSGGSPAGAGAGLPGGPAGGGAADVGSASVMGPPPILPAGAGATTPPPDGAAPGGPGAPGAAASPPPAAAAPTGVQNATAPQTVTGSRDPVATQIRAIAASVQSSNPMLTESECRRVARRVVGGYLRQADQASSVMSDEPWAPSPGSSGGGGGGQGDGGGGSMLEHGLEWKGLKSMMPGGAAAGEAAGAAAGAGEAAGLAEAGGAAAGLARLAPLMAL